MSGNCEDGWDIQVQEDLDLIVEDADACHETKFNLKDTNGTILFPTIQDVKSIKGTLSKDLDVLDLGEIKRVDNIELMPSRGPPDEIIFNKRLVLPAVNMYETTYAGWLTLKDREDAPPLKLGIEQGASLESLVLEDLESLNDLVGTSSLDRFKVKNSEFLADLERIEHLEVSDMTNRIVSLLTVDWIRNAYFTNIKSDTAQLISTQIDSDLFICNNEDLNQSTYQFYSGFTSIGRDLLIRDNSGLDGSFDKLTYAKNITVENTVDSALAWPALEDAVTIQMHHSPGTKLPGNMDNLEFVDDIYLNGEIMTDLGPNIFPALRRVKNSVIVQPWNADFDCRALVAQREMGTINNLHCNGTNGHTNGTVIPARVGYQRPATSTSAKTAVLTPRSLNVQGAGPVHDYHGIKEGQYENASRGPCVGAFGGAGGIMAMGLVLGLLGLVFVSFRRRQQQQRQRRSRICVVPAEEEGLEDEEKKLMTTQRVRREKSNY